MVSFVEALEQGITDAFCQLLSLEASFEDFFGQNFPQVGRPYYNVGRGAYNLICNRTPPPPPPAQFPEGQCPVSYRVVNNYEYRLNSANWIPDEFVRECGLPQNSAFGPFSNFRREERNGGVAYYVDGFNASGDPIEYAMTDGFNLQTGDVRNGVISYERCDGQPDDCGVSTPTPPPSGYNQTDIDITYTDNNNIDITVPVGITLIRPVINNDFDVIVPIRLEVGDLNLNVPVDISAEFNLTTGDINFNIGGNNGYDDRGGDDRSDPITIDLPEAPPPESDSPDVPEPDDALFERRIIGALVTVQEPGIRIGLISSGGNVPDIYVPALCWILFNVRVSGQSTAYIKHIPVNLLREFIPCPWEGGALSIRVANPNGSQLSVQPVYRKVDITNEIQ